MVESGEKVLKKYDLMLESCEKVLKNMNLWWKVVRRY